MKQIVILFYYVYQILYYVNKCIKGVHSNLVPRPVTTAVVQCCMLKNGVLRAILKNRAGMVLGTRHGGLNFSSKNVYYAHLIVLEA